MLIGCWHEKRKNGCLVPGQWDVLLNDSHELLMNEALYNMIIFVFSCTQLNFLNNINYQIVVKTEKKTQTANKKK